VTENRPNSDRPHETLESFSERARTWLASNLKRDDREDLKRLPIQRRHPVEYYTREVMAANRSLQRKLNEAGFAGITWPKEYGGQGLAAEYDAAFARQAEPYEMPIFGPLSVTTYQICVPTMLAHCDPEFLRSFIPRVLNGEILVCQFFSEPSAGSDLAGCRMRADVDGGDWRLNGQKIWSSFAHLADWGMCLTRTDWDAPKHRGLTWFAVPCDASGVTVRPIRTVSESTEFCEAFFDDVVVPDKSRIGAVNGGWNLFKNTTLAFERGAGRTNESPNRPALGPLAPDLVTLAQRYERTEDTTVRQRIAEAHTNDFVGKVLAWRVRQLRDSEQSANAGAEAYSKLFEGTYGPIRARLALEIGGAPSLTWEAGDPTGAAMSRAYLMSRVASIAGGTNEMQRNSISEQSLRLPREPSFDTNKSFRQVLSDAERWKETGR